MNRQISSLALAQHLSSFARNLGSALSAPLGRRFLVLCAAVCSLLAANLAEAGTVMGPITGVTSVPGLGNLSSEYGGRPASATTNGFGFDGTDFTFPGPTTSGLSAGSLVDPDTGYTIPVHTTSVSQMWLTNNQEPGVITYNLGSTRRVDRVWIYNYNEAGAAAGPTPYTLRGAADTGTVLTSVDGVSYTVLTGASNVALKQADGLANLGNNGLGVSGDITSVSLLGVEARYVRFSNLFTYPGGDNNFLGLSEVIFFEANPPAPEPSTMLMLGLGGLGLVRRTRRLRRRS